MIILGVTLCLFGVFSLPPFKLCLFNAPEPCQFHKKREVSCTNGNRCCYLVIQITVPNFPARYPLGVRAECLSNRMMLLSNTAKQLCRSCLDSSAQLHDC